jgi:hypothetical protein
MKSVFIFILVVTSFPLAALAQTSQGTKPPDKDADKKQSAAKTPKAPAKDEEKEQPKGE